VDQTHLCPPASVINRVTAARTDAYGAVIEALIEDREGLPVGTAEIQVAVRAVKGGQLPVDPPERYRVGAWLVTTSWTASRVAASANLLAVPRK
jgi:hypothetical protein